MGKENIHELAILGSTHVVEATAYKVQVAEKRKLFGFRHHRRARSDAYAMKEQHRLLPPPPSSCSLHTSHIRIRFARHGLELCVFQNRNHFCTEITKVFNPKARPSPKRRDVEWILMIIGCGSRPKLHTPLSICRIPGCNH